MKPVYILGGAQSDFARNLARQRLTLYDLFTETLQQALADAAVNPAQLEVGHVGNFVSDLFTGQAHLGGFFAEAEPALYGMPTVRHEAACASGSMAVLAAWRDIQSGCYDTAVVLGIEQMKNVPGAEAADHLAAAAWRGEEHADVPFLWPAQFAELAEVYHEHRSLERNWLMAISDNAFTNARKNPLAQTRNWTIGEAELSTDDTANPPIAGLLRKQDCGQVTDGAAAVVLASEAAAASWAAREGVSLADIPRLTGWGHTGAPIRLAAKTAGLAQSDPAAPVFPHVARAFQDCWQRAGLAGPGQVRGVELHDCFSITGYMLLDHLGLAPTGEAWRLLEQGIGPADALAVNPSGGLIGLGHPVGATGVRMVLDAARQVSHRAGPTQVDLPSQADETHFATFNIGGSATTVACLMVSQ